MILQRSPLYRSALLCIDRADLCAVTCTSTAGLCGLDSNRRTPFVRKGHMDGGRRGGAELRGLIPAAYLLITAITRATLACLFVCLLEGRITVFASRWLGGRRVRRTSERGWRWGRLQSEVVPGRDKRSTDPPAAIIILNIAPPSSPSLPPLYLFLSSFQSKAPNLWGVGVTSQCGCSSTSLTITMVSWHHCLIM